MKSILTLTAILISVLPVFSQIPDVHFSEDVTLKTWGYLQGVAVEGADNPFVDRNFRLLTDVGSSDWGFFTEANLSKIDEPGHDWLLRAYLRHQLDENWELRFGRFLTSPGFLVPGSGDLETINYPFSYPFRVYAWGAQVYGELDDGWTVIGDITGNSSQTFHDYPFNSFEVSGRLKKDFGGWSLGGAGQFGEDFFKLATDFSVQPAEKLSLRGTVFYADSSDGFFKDHVGAYCLALYRPVEWLELQQQLEYRHNHTSDLIWTSGFRLLPAKNFNLTFNYETVLDGPRDDRFLCEVQVSL